MTGYWRTGSVRTGFERLHQKMWVVCNLEGQAGRIKQSESLKRSEMLLCPAHCSGQELLRFMAVKVFKGFKFFNKCLVLVLQDGNSVLQTLNILLLLPATFTGCLSAEGMRHNLSFKSVLRAPGASLARPVGSFPASESSSQVGCWEVSHASAKTPTDRHRPTHPTPPIPVLHEADFPFAGNFLRSTLGREGWGWGHDNSWGDGARRGCSDLISLDVTGGSCGGIKRVLKLLKSIGLLESICHKLVWWKRTFQKKLKSLLPVTQDKMQWMHSDVTKVQISGIAGYIPVTLPYLIQMTSAQAHLGPPPGYWEPVSAGHHWSVHTGVWWLQAGQLLLRWPWSESEGPGRRLYHYSPAGWLHPVWLQLSVWREGRMTKRRNNYNVAFIQYSFIRIS